MAKAKCDVTVKEHDTYVSVCIIDRTYKAWAEQVALIYRDGQTHDRYSVTVFGDDIGQYGCTSVQVPTWDDALILARASGK